MVSISFIHCFISDDNFFSDDPIRAIWSWCMLHPHFSQYRRERWQRHHLSARPTAVPEEPAFAVPVCPRTKYWVRGSSLASWISIRAHGLSVYTVSLRQIYSLFLNHFVGSIYWTGLEIKKSQKGGNFANLVNRKHNIQNSIKNYHQRTRKWHFRPILCIIRSFQRASKTKKKEIRF